MARIRSIDSLKSFRGKKIALRVPKSASHKAPDYLVLHEEQKRTKVVKGKKVTVTVPARDIYPEPSVISAASVCTMGKGKHQLRPGCHVEFVLLGTKHATEAGVTPGAYLRLCSSVGQKDAPLRKVSDHQEALRVSREYCACTKSSKDTAACARKVLGNGRAPRRQRG